MYKYSERVKTVSKVNDTLGELDLEGNRLGAVGARALATALLQNEALVVLNLGDAAVGDEGAAALAELTMRSILRFSGRFVQNFRFLRF